MSLLQRINLWLCLCFGLVLLTSTLMARSAMRDEARDDALEDARQLMETAQATRDYTAREVAPIVGADAILTAVDFYPQTVPAYAATQVLDAVRRRRPEYVYREATLNPTNPRDRAMAWEADVIQYLSANPKAEEIANERDGAMGRSLYLARPIRIDDGNCLACHDTPAKAPPSVVRRYGGSNGFGWKLHDTVGAQIVSVPLATALARVDRTVAIIAGMLMALFAVMFIAVNLVVRAVVLRPIAKLARAAEHISTGHAVDVALNVPGHDEISQLCRAFDRMRTSVEKSLSLLRSQP
jgi:protein-histidine pros-kinase